MNKTSDNDTLKNILETTKNIFLTLVNNPDYQGTNKKSREDVVLQESLQRAKQHERNKMALSMIQNSHLERFADFIVKQPSDSASDEDDIESQITSPRVQVLKGVKMVNMENINRPNETINTLRQGLSINQWGNPFTLADFAQNPQKPTPDEIKNVVQLYHNWIVTGRLAEKPEGKSPWTKGQRERLEKQRSWMENTMRKGGLQGKQLLYHTDYGVDENNEPIQSHADVLARIAIQLHSANQPLPVDREEFEEDSDLERLAVPVDHGEESEEDITHSDDINERFDSRRTVQKLGTIGGPSDKEFELNPLSAIINLLNVHTDSSERKSASTFNDFSKFIDDMKELTKPMSSTSRNPRTGEVTSIQGPGHLVRRAMTGRVSTYADKDTWGGTESMAGDPDALGIRQQFQQQDIEDGLTDGMSYNNAFQKAVTDMSKSISLMLTYISSENLMMDSRGSWKRDWNDMVLPAGINKTDDFNATYRSLSEKRADIAANARNLASDTLRTLMPTIASYNAETGQTSNRNFATLLAPDPKMNLPSVDPSITESYQRPNALAIIQRAQGMAQKKHQKDEFKGLLDSLWDRYGAATPINDPLYDTTMNSIMRTIQWGDDAKDYTARNKQPLVDMYMQHLQRIVTAGGETPIEPEVWEAFQTLEPEDQVIALARWNEHPGKLGGTVSGGGADRKAIQLSQGTQEYRTRQAAVAAMYNVTSAIDRYVARDPESHDIITDESGEVPIGLSPEHENYAELQDLIDEYNRKADLSGLPDFINMDDDQLKDVMEGNVDFLNNWNYSAIEEHEAVLQQNKPLFGEESRNITGFGADVPNVEDEENPAYNEPLEEGERSNDFEDLKEVLNFERGEQGTTSQTSSEILMDIIDETRVRRIRQGARSTNSDERSNISPFDIVNDRMQSSSDADALQSLADRLHNIDGVTGVSLRGEIAKALTSVPNHKFDDRQIGPDGLVTPSTGIQMNIAHKEGADVEEIQSVLDAFQTRYAERYPDGVLNRAIEPRFVANSDSEYGVPLSTTKGSRKSNRGLIDENINPNQLAVVISGDKSYARWAHNHTAQIDKTTGKTTGAAYRQQGGEWGGNFLNRSSRTGADLPFIPSDAALATLFNSTGQYAGSNVHYATQWQRYPDPRGESGLGNLEDDIYVQQVRDFINSLPEGTVVIDNGLPGANAAAMHFAHKRGDLDIQGYKEERKGEKENAELIANKVKPQMLVHFGHDDGSEDSSLRALREALPNVREVDGRRPEEWRNFFPEEGETTEEVQSLINAENLSDVEAFNAQFEPADDHQVVFKNPNLGRQLPTIGNYDPAGYNKSSATYDIKPMLEDPDIRTMLADGSKMVETLGIGPLKGRTSKGETTAIGSRDLKTGPRTQAKNIIAQSFTDLGVLKPEESREAAKHHPFMQDHPTRYAHADDNLERKRIQNLGDHVLNTVPFTEGSSQSTPSLLPNIFSAIDSNIGITPLETPHALKGWESDKNSKDENNATAKYHIRNFLRMMAMDPTQAWWSNLVRDIDLIQTMKDDPDNPGQRIPSGQTIPDTRQSNRKGLDDILPKRPVYQGYNIDEQEVIDADTGETVIDPDTGKPEVHRYILPSDDLEYPPGTRIGTEDLPGREMRPVSEMDGKSRLKLKIANNPQAVFEWFLYRTKGSTTISEKTMADLIPEIAKISLSLTNTGSFSTPADAEKRVDGWDALSHILRIGRVEKEEKYDVDPNTGKYIWDTSDNKELDKLFPDKLIHKEKAEELTHAHDPNWGEGALVKKITELLGYKSPLLMLKDLAFDPQEGESQIIKTQAVTPAQLQEIADDPELQPLLKHIQEKITTVEDQTPFILSLPFNIPTIKDLKNKSDIAQKTINTGYYDGVHFGNGCRFQVMLVDSNGATFELGSMVPEWNDLLKANKGGEHLNDVTYRWLTHSNQESDTPDLMQVSGRTSVHGVSELAKKMTHSGEFIKLTNIDDLVNLGHIDKTQEQVRKNLRELDPHSLQQFISQLHNAALNPEGDPRELVKSLVEQAGERAVTPETNYDRLSHSYERGPENETRFSRKVSDFDDSHIQQMIQYAHSVIQDQGQPPESYFYNVRYPTMDYDDPVSGESRTGPLVDPLQAERILRIVSDAFETPSNFDASTSAQVYQGQLRAILGEQYDDTRSLTSDVRGILTDLFKPDMQLEPYEWDTFTNQIDVLTQGSNYNFGTEQAAFIKPFVIMQALDDYNRILREAVESSDAGTEFELAQQLRSMFTDEVSIDFLDDGQYNPRNEANHTPHRGQKAYRQARTAADEVTSKGSHKYAVAAALDEFETTGVLSPVLQENIAQTLKDDELLIPLSSLDALKWLDRGIFDLNPNQFMHFTPDGLFDSEKMYAQTFSTGAARKAGQYTGGLWTVRNHMDKVYDKLPALNQIAEKLGYDDVSEMLEREGILVPHMPASYTQDVNGAWQSGPATSVGFQPITIDDIQNLGRKINTWGELNPSLTRSLQRELFDDADQKYLGSLEDPDQFNDAVFKVDRFNSVLDGVERIKQAGKLLDLMNDPTQVEDFMTHLGPEGLTLEDGRALDFLIARDAAGQPLLSADNYGELQEEEREHLAPFFADDGRLYKALMNTTEEGAHFLLQARRADSLSGFKETAYSRLPQVHVLQRDAEGNIHIQPTVVSFGLNKEGEYELGPRHSHFQSLGEGDNVHTNTAAGRKYSTVKAAKPITSYLEDANKALEVLGSPFSIDPIATDIDFDNPDGSVSTWIQDTLSKLRWLQDNAGPIHTTSAEVNRLRRTIIPQLTEALTTVSHPRDEGYTVPNTNVKIGWATDRDGNHAPHLQAIDLVRDYHSPQFSKRGYNNIVSVEEYLDHAFDYMTKSVLHSGNIRTPQWTIDETTGKPVPVNDAHYLLQTGDETHLRHNTDILQGYKDYILSLKDVAKEKLVGRQEATIHDAWATEAMIIVNQLGKHVLPQVLIGQEPSMIEHLNNDFVIKTSADPTKRGLGADNIQGIPKDILQTNWKLVYEDVFDDPMAVSDDLETEDVLLAKRQKEFDLHQRMADEFGLEPPDPTKYFDPERVASYVGEEGESVDEKAMADRWSVSPAQGRNVEITVREDADGNIIAQSYKDTNRIQIVNPDGSITEDADQHAAGVFPMDARLAMERGVNYKRHNSAGREDPYLIPLASTNQIPVDVKPVLVPAEKGVHDIYRAGQKVGVVDGLEIKDNNGKRIALTLSSAHVMELLGGAVMPVKRDDGSVEAVHLNGSSDGLGITQVANTLDNTPSMVLPLQDIPHCSDCNFLSPMSEFGERVPMLHTDLMNTAIEQNWPYEAVLAVYRTWKEMNGPNGTQNHAVQGGVREYMDNLDKVDPNTNPVASYESIPALDNLFNNTVTPETQAVIKTIQNNTNEGGNHSRRNIIKNNAEMRRVKNILTKGAEVEGPVDPNYDGLQWLGKYLFDGDFANTDNWQTLNDHMMENGFSSLFNKNGTMLWHPIKNVDGDSHDDERIYKGARQWTGDLMQLARGLDVEGREGDEELKANFSAFWDNAELGDDFRQGVQKIQDAAGDNDIPHVHVAADVTNPYANTYGGNGQINRNAALTDEDIGLHEEHYQNNNVAPWKLSANALKYLNKQGFNIDADIVESENTWDPRLYSFIPNGIDPNSVIGSEDPNDWVMNTDGTLGMNPDFAGINAWENPNQWQVLMKMFSGNGEIRDESNPDGGFDGVQLSQRDIIPNHLRGGNYGEDKGVRASEHLFFEDFGGAVPRKISTRTLQNLLGGVKQENPTYETIIDNAAQEKEVASDQITVPEHYRGARHTEGPWWGQTTPSKPATPPKTTTSNIRADGKVDPEGAVMQQQKIQQLASQPQDPQAILNTGLIPAADGLPWIAYGEEKFWNVSPDDKGHASSIGSEVNLPKDIKESLLQAYNDGDVEAVNNDPVIQDLQMRTRIDNLPSHLQDVWHVMAQEHGDGDILTAMKRVQDVESGSHVRNSAKHRYDQLRSMSKPNLAKLTQHLDDDAESAGVEQAPQTGMKDLRAKAQQLYRKVVSTPNSPGGWALPDAYFDGKSEDEVQKMISGLQENLKEKEVSIREQATSAKANNIGHLQLTPGATPEMVQQLGRQLMLHQINYSHKDQKGKDYMTDESKEQLRAAWQSVEQSGMLDMDSLMSELGSVTRAAEQKGWPTDPEDAEKMVNPWEDHVNRIERNMRDDQMAREDLVANLASEGMDHVNNPNNGANRFTMGGQAVDMQGNPVEETPYQNDLVAPTIMGLTPQVQSVWQEYHQQKLRTRGLAFEETPTDVIASMQQNLDYLRQAGFQDEWLEKAGQTQQELNGVEYGPNGLPLDDEGNEEVPPQIYNPLTEELETAQIFHEGTRSWINPHILGEHMKGVEDHVFVPHFGLIRQRADKMPEGYDVDQTSPMLQGIIPSSTSTLAQNSNIVIGPSGIQRVYRDEYPSKENGPLSATDAAAYALGTQIETDIEQNQDNYQHGFVPMILPQPDAPEQVPLSQPVETLADTGIVEQQSNPVDMPAPEGASAVAQFLARVRGHRPTGRETVADQLHAGAKDFLDNLGGIYNTNWGGIIPADEGYHVRRAAENQRKQNYEKREIMQNLADAQGIDLNTPRMQEMLDTQYPVYETQPVQPEPQVPQPTPTVPQQMPDVPPVSGQPGAMNAFTTWQNQQQMPTTGADIYGEIPDPTQQQIPDPTQQIPPA